ncbi:MAG: alpha-amylase family glycosyl hydrolase, partial [Pseudomonadota bacterium]
TLAEVGGPDALGEMQLFTRGSDRLNSAYSFDYLYSPDISPELIERTALSWRDEPGEGWPSWAFSNHDAPRSVSRWHDGSDPTAYCKLLAMLLLSLRGNAIVYQGEELGLPQAYVPFERLQDPEALANWPKTLGRDGARTPFPWTSDTEHAGFSKAAETWLPIDPAHYAMNAEAQATDPMSVLHFYRALIKMRRQVPALMTGGISFKASDGDIVDFVRAEGESRVRVILNFGAETVELSSLGVTTKALMTSWRPPTETNVAVGSLPPFGGALFMA